MNPATAGELSAHTRFWRLQASYHDKFDARTELNVVAAVGQDAQQTGMGTTFNDTSTIPVSARVELSQKVIRGVTANIGYDFHVEPYSLHLRRPPPRAPGVASAGPGDLAVETSASGLNVFPGMYTDWPIIPWAGTRLVPGLRADYSTPSKTWDISPRLVIRQDIARDFPRTVVKGGIGLFYQPPQPIEIDPVFGTPGLLDSRALQVDVGAEQEITSQLGLSIDVFYKVLDRLIVPRQGNTGTGRAYGTEFLLRYKADEHFFGWLAYTISPSERRDVPADPFRLFAFDQTHVLTLIGSYDFGGGVRLGARFQLVSGNLSSTNSEGAFDATTGSPLPVTSYPPSGQRLPLFHQLDIRLDKTWRFRKWTLSTYLDVINVYNYEAPEGQTYNYNFTQSAPVKGIPIIPNLGIRGEL